jgi:Tol biopolymer transport system component
MSPVESTEPPGATVKGWVAFQSDENGGKDVYLVRAGDSPRRVSLADLDLSDETCPAFSPDGERLMFGRAAKVSGSDDDGFRNAELVIVTLSDDGSVAPLNAIPLDGMNALPCATWAPDGRWAAFGGADASWVVDTMTNEIRRLPGYNPHDLEWRPGTDQLAIAGNRPVNYISDSPIVLYSVGTGEIRILSDVEAANITWSPDGTTIAFTHGEDQADSGIWLVDADGTNRRQLTNKTGGVLHGIGVVWSPRGGLIANPRKCQEHPHGEDGTLIPSCSEQHEVVLVTATGDADSPIGNEVVMGPPRTQGADGPVWWFPSSVTWSPDGTQLLYTAWSEQDSAGVIAVPIDTDKVPVVLNGEIAPGAYDGSPWVPTQQWRRSGG